MKRSEASELHDGRPPIKSFFIAYAVLTMLAVAVAVAPVFAGAAPGYLTVLTPLMQWIPFVTVVVLHGIFRVRRTRDARHRQWSLSGAAATRVRGRMGAIGRASLLALCALALVCVVPILVSGAVGFVSLRWGDGALTAILLTLPVTLLFMIPVAGEELAWRGYLTTLLSPRGFAFTTALIGGLWAVWHLPLLIAYSWAGEIASRDVVSKTVDLLLAAVLVSALRYLSSSVWPAVFAHSLFTNLFQMAQFNFMTPLSEATTGGYWGYMAISWFAWIVLDVILVIAVMRSTQGRLTQTTRSGTWSLTRFSGHQL